MSSGAVLTEVASTKRSVIDTIQQGVTRRPDITLIPTHPMAGSERRGAPHASADLFEDSVCIFTPLPDTPTDELKKLEHLWVALGTTIREMTPEEHDRTVAAVSHLPHLAASCVARCVNPQQGQFAGGGYVDTTRIASGDPRLWRDICESNADEVNAAIETLIERLQELHESLSNDRFEEVQEFLADAKRKRDSIIEELSD
jgi:prephenate dehydrogenase